MIVGRSNMGSFPAFFVVATNIGESTIFQQKIINFAAL